MNANSKRMNVNNEARGEQKMKFGKVVFGLALALLSATGVWAQAGDTSSKPVEIASTKPDAGREQTFYLANSIQGNDANEILVAMRNMLDPHIRIYLVTSQNAIVVQASPDQLELAQKLIHDLDRPKKTYRLTYTITEMDSGKSIGTQHFSMVVVTGQKTTLKQGSKVPVLTGSYDPGSSKEQTQYTYLDIGMNFAATLDEFANGVRLQSKVEQSSIAEDRAGAVGQDPIVRQSVLEGTAFLSLGKPLMLGSVDIPGSTRHLDIGVVMELVQ
jgi:type II secretory pathway component GspD/PulD (secretin)